MNKFDFKQHIEEIQKARLQSDKDVLDSLAGAIDRLQKAFPRRGHFIMEFIQNADDARSTSIKIEINRDLIKILNDGQPFSKEDVESICKVGRSFKTAEEYIGYLGVGFKSVFLVSECPQIYSGNYRFKFDKNHWPNPRNVPWQIIPIWIDEDNLGNSKNGQFKTMFILPVSTKIDKVLFEKILEETNPEHLSDRILLFLRNIKEIEIHDQIRDAERKIAKSDNISASPEYEIYTLTEYENDSLKHEDKWLVFRSVVEVPSNVKEDWVTKDWERETVTKRELVAAFKLDAEDNLVEEKGTAHIGVFSFLPLKEVPSGLKFLIQADFLTAPGREVIEREALWNEWLAKEIFNLISKKCIKVFLSHQRWKTNFTKILYPGEWGHPIFDENIKKPLRDFLESTPVLIAEDDSIVKISDSVLIEPYIRELLSKSDLTTLYPDKKALHSNIEMPLDIERNVERGPSFTANSGVSSKMQEMINLKAKCKDFRFFKDFYKKLSVYAESTLKDSPLKYQNIILTNDEQLTDSRSVYIKSKYLTIPPEIQDNFKLVHPNLETDPETLSFLKKLGVNELTEQHVQNILKTKEIPQISKNWSTLSENERLERIKLLKDMWERHQIDVRDLGFLTLKTKNKKWLEPKEVIFPKEYNPEHKIETLMEKGLYDRPLEFLSADFLAGKKDEEIKEWHRFFKELGVDGKLEKEKVNIVQRIGILTALAFERKRKREPRELGESEKLGYDIASKSYSEERYIEVKSSSEPSPDIFLSVNEFKALQEKQDRYFVYVVKDALRNPILCVNKGKKILDISDVKTIIPFSKWWSSSKEEEFQP
jgi:Fe-S cluster biosynthesis and repair protein YggX